MLNYDTKLVDLIRAFEENKHNDTLGHYETIICSLGEIANKLNKESDEANVFAIEAIYDKIKVSIDKLADDLPEKIKKTNNSIKKNVNIIKKLVNKVLESEDKLKDKIGNIDKEEFQEIEVKDVLTFKDYDDHVVFTSTILSKEKDYAKDIVKGKDELASSLMKDIISLHTKIGIAIEKNKMAHSGYRLGVKKEYTEKFVKNKTPLEELGYDKKKVNKCITNLKAYQKEISKPTRLQIVSDIKEKATQILTDFSKMKEKDSQVTAKKITLTTIQLCRCYFYLMVLNEFYNLSVWTPHYSTVNILEFINAYKPIEAPEEDMDDEEDDAEDADTEDEDTEEEEEDTEEEESEEETALVKLKKMIFRRR